MATKAKTPARPTPRETPQPQGGTIGRDTLNTAAQAAAVEGVQAGIAPPAPPIPGIGHNSGVAVHPIIPGRAVGVNRSGKPVQRTAAESGVNEFHVPPHLPPEGWSWEWKRESTRGQADPYYLSRLAQLGWESVRYESYPGVFAPQFDEHGKPFVGPVRRNGLILMERDIRLTKEAQEDEKRRARDKLNQSRTQYTRLDTSGTTTAEFDQTARQASYINQTVEPVMAPPTAAQQRIKID